MSDRQVFNYGIIQDQFAKAYHDALKHGVSRHYDQLTDELASSQVLKASALPRGDQYAVRGVLMKGIMENAFLQQVQLPRAIIREWAEGRYEALRSLPKGGSDGVSLLIQESITKGDTSHLSNAIRINWNTMDFRRRLELQAGVNLANRMGARFSDTLVYQLKLLADNALKTALLTTGKEVAQIVSTLDEEEVNLLEDEVRRSISFRDTTGAIRFHVEREKLSFRRDTASSKAADYRPLLDRSLNRLRNNDVLRRIDNLDRQIGGYVAEYCEVLEQGEQPGFALMLTSITNMLASQLAYNQSSAPQDERIDPSSVIMLQEFIQSSNIFVQSFESIEEALRDKQRALELAKGWTKTSEPLRWNALRQTARAPDVFEEQSKAALLKLGEALNTEGGEPSGYLVVVGMGALRGSLRAMAGEVLEKSTAEERKKETSFVSELPKEAAKEAVKELVKAGFKNEGLSKAILQFFADNQSWLYGLAIGVPTYFGWISPFMAYLKAYFWG